MHITLSGLLLTIGAAWILGCGDICKGFVRIFILMWVFVGAYVILFLSLVGYAIIYEL